MHQRGQLHCSPHPPFASFVAPGCAPPKAVGWCHHSLNIPSSRSLALTLTCSPSPSVYFCFFSSSLISSSSPSSSNPLFHLRLIYRLPRRFILPPRSIQSPAVPDTPRFLALRLTRSNPRPRPSTLLIHLTASLSGFNKVATTLRWIKPLHKHRRGRYRTP